MSNYASKSGIEKPTGVGTLEYPKKADLGSLKSDVKKLNIVETKTALDKIKTIPVDLKISLKLQMKMLIKTVYDQLVTKLNAIDKSKLVLKN